MKRLTTTILVAGAALLAPMLPVAQAAPADAWTIDEVGAPLTDVNIRTSAMGALPDGTPVIYAPTYGEPALLSVVHGETGALLSSHPLGDKTTSTYTGLSPDGSAYAAGQTPGANLFRYDPTTDSVTDLGAPVAGESNISRLTTFADDGTLYSGTFPNDHVFSYHPDRGFTDFGPIAEGEQYARSTAFDGEDTLYVGTGTNSRFFAMDIATGDKTEILLPEDYREGQTYINEMYYRDGLVFAFVSPGYAYLVYDTVTGEWLEPLTDIQASPISDVVDGWVYYINRTPNDLFRYHLASGEVEQVTDRNQFSLNNVRGFGLLELQDPAWPGLTVAGMGLTGRMWHYNLDTGQLRWIDSEAEAGALKIAALGMAPDQRLYAAGYLTPGTMSRIDIDSLEMEALSGVSQSQFVGTVELPGSAPQMYIGGYSDAGVWRFDHTKDWNYPSNPSRLARLDSLNQERVLAITAAGSDLAVASLGLKGTLGGHLTILNPLDSSIRYSDEPVEGLAVASMHHVEVDGRSLLVGGTTSHQLGIEHPDGESRLFLFDLETLTTVAVTNPLPGVTSITKILELPDGRLWAFANDSSIRELHVDSDASGAVTVTSTPVVSIYGETRHAGNWAGARMHMLDDDTIVGNAAGSVYTLDVATLEVTVIAQGSDATPTGDGRFFFARNTFVYRATPEGWIPPEPTDPDPDPEPVEYYNYAAAEHGGTATTSSAHAPYSAEMLIDGDTSSVASRWISAAGDPAPWLEITFAEESPIDSVQLHQFANYELHDYDIQAAVDGEWVTVLEIRDNLALSPLHRFDGVRATALRIDGFTSRDGRARLYEVAATCEASDLCAEEVPGAAPETTARYVGNNWIDVHLTAQGDDGVGETRYRLDDGEWRTYNEPLRLKRSDRQTLQYYSASPDGTAEDTRCVSFAPGGGRVDVTVDPTLATCTS